jgi:methyl-accepting chemotaxis protein
MRKKLLLKFMVPALAITLVTVVVLGGIAAHFLALQVRQRAQATAQAEADRVIEALGTVDALSADSVRSAMKVLMKEGRTLGVPEVKGTTTLAGNTVPDLYLGGASQVSNFALVDRIKELTGNTATLFVKRDDAFVRVSTNVLKADGSRAVGTVLDPNGRAIAAIRQQQPFYGVVDILNKPYITGYEPMRDASGRVVGVWYVGAPLESLAHLGQHISATRILNNGFVALLRHDGTAIFKSQGVQDEAIQGYLHAGAAGGWTVISKPFDPWAYTLLVAYPESDIDLEISRELLQLKLASIACGIIISILLTVIMHMLVTRLVLRPVVRLAGVADRIAAGDVSDEICVTSQDELGELARTFAKMVAYVKEMASVSEAVAGGDLVVDVQPRSSRDVLGNAFRNMIYGLRDMVGSVRDSASQVAAGASQMAQTSDESAKTSTQSASAIEEVTSTMHEMSVNIQSVVTNTQMQAGSVGETSASIHQMVTSIQRVAETAQRLSEISGRSRKEVQSGIAAMQKATDGLSKIKAAIGSSSDIIGELDARAEDISKIIEVIDDISEQTNLLALNAAIEAARAGEHGLGFAVVADEVRKLAEKSAASTKEVSDLVQSIQKNARKAVEDMDRSTASVNEGLALGTDLSTALGSISSVVGEVDTFAQQIGAATAEQTSGSAQISKATERLSDITQEITSAIEEQSSGAVTVVQAMERMRDLVNTQSSGSNELAASAEQMSKMARTLMESMGRFVLDTDQLAYGQAGLTRSPGVRSHHPGADLEDMDDAPPPPKPRALSAAAGR